MPAFKSLTAGPLGNQYIWPMLFVVVACGAISGFHALVGSGTSSKQLRTEKDAIVVGYGSMLLEGMVAVIAIGTIMISNAPAGANPMIVYSQGFGKFASLVGIDPKLGASLGLLAINSFLLTSLDTATRLGRYQVQEFFGGRVNKYLATFAVAGCALLLLFIKTGATPMWQVIWPVFGAANQLVAALSLLTLGTWVAKDLKGNTNWLMYPMWFMLFTTIAALILLIRDQFMAQVTNYPLVIIAAVLMVLAVLMVREALSALRPTPGKAAARA